MIKNVHHKLPSLVLSYKIICEIGYLLNIFTKKTLNKTIC